MITAELDDFNLLRDKFINVPEWVCDASSSDFICMASLEFVCNKFGQMVTEEKTH